jgi:hypothetical protein
VTLDQIKAALVAQAGGYLRNTVLTDTCPVCRTLTSLGSACGPCTRHVATSALPDALGFMIYAGRVPPIEQSESVMYGYKRAPAIRPAAAYNAVALLAYLAIRGHLPCPARLVGRGLTHWSTVPSLTGRQDPHPLREIVAGINDVRAEITLDSTMPPGSNPRETNADYFAAQRPVPANAHVLLIDDTWVSGSRVRSATLALRRDGAAAVSALSLARWLSTDWEPRVTQWARSTFTAKDFDPDICPWTGSACPPTFGSITGPSDA